MWRARLVSCQVFDQFDTDKNGVLDNKELSRALKSLPKTKPTMMPPDAKFLSVDEMIVAMDADGNGGVDLGEWLDNLSKCAGLAAALAESVNEHGMVAKFRSFEQQKAKREGEIEALEMKLMTAGTPAEQEALAAEMADYKSSKYTRARPTCYSHSACRGTRRSLASIVLPGQCCALSSMLIMR